MKKYYKLSNSIKLYAKFLIAFFFIVSNSNCTLGGSRSQQVDSVIIEGGILCIIQHGIIWRIVKEDGTPYSEKDKNLYYGQFVNGDNWVVGPVWVIDIQPRPTDTGTRIMNGSMINPVQTLAQGYDSSSSQLAFDKNLTVGLNLPIILQEDTSLISTESVKQEDRRPQIQNAAVLTIVSAADIPSTGDFRPPYCGTDKTIRFNESQLNYSLLKQLSPVAGTPDLSTVEEYFRGVWIDHLTNYTVDWSHPADNMPHYGREMSTNVSIGALMLHLSFSNEQKRTLLIRFVQLGIDNFGVIQNGAGWPADGGHSSGRKWPILFAGLILNDTSMINVGQHSGDYAYSGSYGPGNPPPDYEHFGEDDQTFYVIQDDIDRTNSASWQPDPRNVADGTTARYVTADINIPEWGIRHATEPYMDNAHWLAIYRNDTAYAWSGFILAARIMEGDISAKTLWNHNALFDYQDRYMAIMAESTANPVWRTSFETTWGTGIWGSYANSTWRQNAFVANMWDEYRDNY